MSITAVQHKNICNVTAEPKQQSPITPKTYFRSPYREATHVVRVPKSLLPTVRNLLEAAKQDAEAAAWLGKA